MTDHDLRRPSSASPAPGDRIAAIPPEGDPSGGIHGRFDLLDHLARQREWSERTFGPGARMAGVVDHIRKELCEIEAKLDDISEWIDVAILALDGAWRAGYSPEAIVAALAAKQAKNERRTWPDWRTAPIDKAIEHTKGDAREDGPRAEPALTSQVQDEPEFTAAEIAELQVAFDVWLQRRRSAERVIDAARVLVTKLEAVHADPRYQGVWELYAMHGGRYDEPTYTAQLDALKTALAERRAGPRCGPGEGGEVAEA